MKRNRAKEQQVAEVEMACQALYEKGLLHRKRSSESWAWMACTKKPDCPGCIEAEPKKCPMHCTAFQWDGKCIHTQGNEERGD